MRMMRMDAAADWPISRKCAGARRREMRFVFVFNKIGTSLPSSRPLNLSNYQIELANMASVVLLMLVGGLRGRRRPLCVYIR